MKSFEFTFPILIATGIFLRFGSSFEHHLRGPSFHVEPPNKVEFTNITGTWIDCIASGNPLPSIHWISADGSPLEETLPERRVLRNGTLVMLPFSAAAYRQDIHDTVYRCVASNTVGKIVSRDVKVRAVVVQAYKVSVEVISAPRGCTAILRCIIPGFVKDVVKVVSWVQDPATHFYPKLQGDGKYHVLPTGELLIHDVQLNDQYPQYRCRTMHRLTRQVVGSPPVTIQISEHRGLVPPTIIEHSGIVHAERDEGIVMSCIAQSCPSSIYRWFKFSGTEPDLVPPSPRTHVLGPILALEAVTSEDAGLYQCSAVNEAGEVTADIRLVVTSSFHVELTPPLLSVRMGGTAEFMCNVHAETQYSRSLTITWFKDGKPLPGLGRHNVDHFVIRGVTRDDTGMYQCIVRRAEGEAEQGSAELQLGDSPPIMMYNFIDQTVQPGPSVSIKCRVNGNPTPEIIWTLDGFPLPNNPRFLVGQYMTITGDVISHVNISQVAVEDGGEYICTGVNRAGKVTHSARLNVYGLPYIRLMPKVTAIAGQTLKVQCPVAGYPIQEIHWEQGGKILPAEIRQTVQPKGVLIITSVQKENDAGVYTCVAKNEEGKSAKRSVEIAVIVPPKLSSSPDRTLNVGERASLTCSVIKGDLPMSMAWLKDGRTVDAQSVTINQLDQYNSILLIESLSQEHNGNYSCYAKNAAAEVSFTTQLFVNVPPRWKIEPNNMVNVIRNEDVMFNCQAEGVPTPKIAWKKASGSKAGDYEEIRDHIYTKTFSNGSLLLRKVKEDAQGVYMCQANNGIGNPIGRMVQLKVNSPPYFTTTSREIMVKKGDDAELQCNVNGDQPITISWFKDGKLELLPHTNYRISLKQEIIAEGVAAEVRISEVGALDSGTYVCQARNIYGQENQVIQLVVQEPPESPWDLKAVSINSRTVKLIWKEPPQDSVEVNRYIVQYKANDASETWKTAKVETSLSSVIDDLRPDTTYAIRVLAEGEAGRSPPSLPLVIKTHAQRPAGPPLHINVRPISSTQILVTWFPPVPELRHGEILGYSVGVRETSSSASNYIFTDVAGDAEEGGEFLISGLSKYTRYSIVVRCFNKMGLGPASEPILTQTLEDVPNMPPEDVRCVALSTQSLQVSWQPPPSSHCNGVLQGYKVHIEPLNDDVQYGTDDLEPKKTTSVTIIITGLRKFTNYSVRVLAFTRVGDGVLTRPTYCQTEEDVPGSPADVKVLVKTSNSLLVSWLPPKEPNGVIIKYNLYMRSDNPSRLDLRQNKHYLSPQQTSYEVENLPLQIEYKFFVTASTKIGEGQSSKIVSQFLSSRIPARIASFGGLVAFPWQTSATLPCIAVGEPDPKREWYKGNQPLKAGVGHNYKILESGEIVFPRLEQSDTANYTCQVDNTQGSDRIIYNLVVQVPPSAPTLYVTSTTSSSILFHWKPGSSGGAVITAFILHYKKSHSDTEELILPRRIHSYELKNLSCGSTYHLFMIAQNKIGMSPQSSTLSVKTQGEAPGVPQGTTLIQPNSTSVLLRLHMWPDSGCPLLYFVIQYRATTDSLWILFSNALKPQKKFLLSGLKPATVYQLKIEAHNVAGSSMAEFTFITLTKDGDQPSPELVTRSHPSHSFLTDLRLIVPLFLTIIALFIALTAAAFCWRNKQVRPLKEADDNSHNMEAQRARYYATLHKVVLRDNNDKIPETAEDISPYATFQLSQMDPPANAMLHSFMYHEEPLTQSCASPPPSGKKSSGERRRTRSRSAKREAQSEESDSEAEELTSSRTESSNQLNGPRLKQSYLYHGPYTNPISEAKSLPRRGRNSANCKKQQPEGSVQQSLASFCPSSPVHGRNELQRPSSRTSTTGERAQRSRMRHRHHEEVETGSEVIAMVSPYAPY